MPILENQCHVSIKYKTNKEEEGTKKNLDMHVPVSPTLAKACERLPVMHKLPVVPPRLHRLAYVLLPIIAIFLALRYGFWLARDGRSRLMQARLGRRLTTAVVLMFNLSQARPGLVSIAQ